jgi:hypothetical protein
MSFPMVEGDHYSTAFIHRILLTLHMTTGSVITISPSMVVQSFVRPSLVFQFLNLYTVGRTLWRGDQSVSRPLPTHRTTQTQNKRTQTSVP